MTQKSLIYLYVIPNLISKIVLHKIQTLSIIKRAKNKNVNSVKYISIISGGNF